MNGEFGADGSAEEGALESVESAANPAARLLGLQRGCQHSGSFAPEWPDDSPDSDVPVAWVCSFELFFVAQVRLHFVRSGRGGAGWSAITVSARFVITWNTAARRGHDSYAPVLARDRGGVLAVVRRPLPVIWLVCAQCESRSVYRLTRLPSTNTTFAGRSANLRMKYGYHSFP